jgi:hypothetical protein
VCRLLGSRCLDLVICIISVEGDHDLHMEGAAGRLGPEQHQEEKKEE